MSKFNEEQAQAAVMETLADLARNVHMAISVTEAGPIYPSDHKWEVECEGQEIIVGDWYCRRIRRVT